MAKKKKKIIGRTNGNGVQDVAVISDPEVVDFSEKYSRPAATTLRNLQAAGNEMVAEYFSAIANNEAWAAAASTDTIGDSNGDSQPYTKGDMLSTVTRFQQVLDGLAGFESSGGLNGANMMDAPLTLVVRAYTGV